MKAQVRITLPLMERLQGILFSRYPDKEWACFFLFGFRKAKKSSGEDLLVIIITELIEPEAGDLNPKVDHVEIQSQYSLRTALTVEQTPLSVGIVHSHPKDYKIRPSKIDDEMDDYYPDFFEGFSKNAAYCSLIFAVDKKGKFSFSGRGSIDGEAFEVFQIFTIGNNSIDLYGVWEPLPLKHFTKRIEDVYGSEAQNRLHNSCVTIIGCGGTGSAVAHILARAGVRKFILIDFDRLEDSNLEKLHGSMVKHLAEKPIPFKVSIIKDLILSINPCAEVMAIVGNILQDLPKNYAVGSDLICCCTDSTHSRVAAGEIAYRYLVPVIDIGVQLEGNDVGKLIAEIVQFTMYGPSLPCPYCRGLVDSWRLTVELMSDDEKAKRKKEAKEAKLRGDEADQYWKDIPALHSVGHLTTLAASFAASYAIGWITGKFHSFAPFFQINLLKEYLGYVPIDMDSKPDCACNIAIGYADQGAEYTIISAPAHWSIPFVL